MAGEAAGAAVVAAVTVRDPWGDAADFEEWLGHLVRIGVLHTTVIPLTGQRGIGPGHRASALLTMLIGMGVEPQVEALEDFPKPAFGQPESEQ